MKKLFILLIILTSGLIFGQEDINIKIQKSEILKENKKFTKLILSKSDENGGLVTVKAVYAGIRAFPKEYIIDHYNSNLKIIKTKYIDNKQLKGLFKNLIVKNNEVTILSLSYNKKTKAINLIKLTSSIKDLNFNKKTLYTLDRDKYKKYFVGAIGFIPFSNGINQMDSDQGGRISFSKNKKYFSLYFDIKNKDKESHLFIVFNDKYEQIYSKLFETDIEDKNFNFKDVDIRDEDGAIFILGKVYNKKDKKDKKSDGYHYELFKLTENSNKKLTLTNGENHISSLYLVHNNNNLILIGFYGDEKMTKITGICRFFLSDDLTVKNKSFEPFTEQLYKDDYKKRKNKKRQKKGLQMFEIKSVFFNSDDSVIINAEQEYTTTQYISSNSGGYWRTVYHFDDILSVKTGPTGKIIWSRIINKKQVGLANSSFTAMPVNNKNYIFVNSSDKIAEMPDGKIGVPSTYVKKSNVWVIVINENGKFSSKKLIDDKESKVWYKVSDGIPDTKNNSIIFQGIRKKYQRIVKFTIN